MHQDHVPYWSSQGLDTALQVKVSNELGGSDLDLWLSVAGDLKAKY